eukprot:symbB.v1.2.020647.t2/scaffold1750.1/size103142/7
MNPFHSLVGIRGAEVIKDESKKVLTERHQLYNVLGEEPTLEDSNFQGHYTLRIDGQEVCGLEVLGLQPWKVVLGSPWACDQHASSLAVLADELRRRFRRWGCSLVYDTKDARAIKCGLPACGGLMGSCERIRRCRRGRREDPSVLPWTTGPSPGRPLAATEAAGNLGRGTAEASRTTEARGAAEEALRQKELQKEQQLKEFRQRKCTVEEMCQGLPSHTRDWEEHPSQLLEMLEGKFKQRGISRLSSCEAWLGRHADRKAARKAYLMLARKWHPDKWAVQGARCVAVATEVAKELVWAYEQACIELPDPPNHLGWCFFQRDGGGLERTPWRQEMTFPPFAGAHRSPPRPLITLQHPRTFLDGDASQHFGLMRRKQPMRIAVTGIPMGLSEEQQTRLARAPFLIPWEALPFHSGRLVFPVALRFLSPLFGSNPSESGGARG